MKKWLYGAPLALCVVLLAAVLWQSQKLDALNTEISSLTAALEQQAQETSGLREQVEEILRAGGITKLTAVVNGGQTRAESVQKGINWCSKKVGLIAVHDGARPLVSQRIITETIYLAAKTGAAAPAVPVRDTIRVVEGGLGVETPERTKLYAMQTPQIFDADLLRAATLNAMQKKLPVTDDCAALEAIGAKISITQGAEENLTVTTRLDLAVAEALARRSDAT